MTPEQWSATKNKLTADTSDKSNYGLFQKRNISMRLNNTDKILGQFVLLFDLLCLIYLTL